jgi:cell division protein FtsI/penicillin-binding protein 2
MRMTVAEIIEQSSNVGTIQIGLKLGEARLDRYVRKFGFGSETGLDFPGESSGIVLDRKDWTGPTIATVPIGQGIAVTPMQMAAAYSTIANGGVWVEPKLLSGTMVGSGRVQSATAPATRRVLSEMTAAQMTKILTGVAEVGTGLEAQIPGYAVAGKTGTAQKPLETGGYGNSYVASFAGFAPASRPAVVVLVVLDNPSPIWGGSTAAPTFKTITEFALRHLGVAPTANAARTAEEIQTEQAEDSPTYD